jgi:hypothetical protein
MNRVMTKSEAAEYCRLTPAGFGYWVRTGKMPGPIPGTHRWDRVAIERALDRMSGLESAAPAQSALAKWLEAQDDETAKRRENSQVQVKRRV